MNKLFIFCIATLIVISGCSTSDDLDISIPDQQKEIVVECYLTPGYPMELTLIENNLLNDELTLISLWNADVSITLGDSVYHLQNLFYRKKDRQVFVNYRHDDTLRIEPDIPISLKVVSKYNDTLYAETRTLSSIDIVDCKLENEKVRIQFSGTSDASPFFRISLSGFVADSIKSSKSVYVDNKSVIGNLIEIQCPAELLNADSLQVSLFHIQKEYYEYMQSVNNATSAYYDPFTIPQSIKSNINGGIGIFTFYTVDKRTIYRKRQ